MPQRESESDARCMGGYTCGVIFEVGPLCCKKLCLRKDFYSGPLVTPITCDPSYHNGQTGCLE